MAMYIQQNLTLDLYGDGSATVFSYDLTKPPISSGFQGVLPLTIGTPSAVASTVYWVGAPQIGLDINNSPIYDQPSLTIGLTGTTLTITFASALKQFGSTYTDGSSNQWNIGSYTVELTFKYNSLL